jgi:hypothetical protein
VTKAASGSWMRSGHRTWVSGPRGS